MTNDELVDVIEAMVHIWPSMVVPQGERALSVWRMVLGDVTGQEAMGAVMELAQSGAEFPPNVGMIYKKAQGMREWKAFLSSGIFDEG